MLNLGFIFLISEFAEKLLTQFTKILSVTPKSMRTRCGAVEIIQVRAIVKLRLEI